MTINKQMSFADAVAILAARSGDIDSARWVVANDVSIYAIIDEGDFDGFGDWIAAGDYTGNETAQSIAEEWNSL